MRKIYERIRADLRYWGGRLNAAQAVIVAAIVANAGKLEPAIAALVPDAYRPVAGLVAGVIAYLVVQAASSSDAKKVAANGGR